MFAQLSDIGRVRRSNQDHSAASPATGVYVVCDGMGGAAGGELASRMAAETFVAQMEASHGTVAQPGVTPKSRLLDAALAANHVVFEEGQREPELAGMGTTMVALLLVPPPVRERRRLPRAPLPRFLTPPDLFLLNVGDSRCYRRRDGHLLQLSTDHSFVEEQVRAGQITSAQAVVSPMRNYITRAVGPSERVEPDIESHRSRRGDLLLLCTDGLSRELSTAQIAAVLDRALPAGVPDEADLHRAAQALIDAANHEGGHDNTTVLLLRCP